MKPPQQQIESPGGWTLWQLRLYRIAIACCVLIWNFTIPSESLPPQQRIAISILAVLTATGTNLSRIAAAAILLDFAAYVSNRDLPPAPLPAALLFAVLAGPATFRLYAFLILAQIAAATAVLNTRDWQWILLAVPALIPPAWIPGARPPQHQQERLFYDGHCGLCHHAIQFLLSEDADGSRFRFAPLDSDSFRATVSESMRATLPDSVVVWTSSHTVLCKSRAAIHVLHRLGGYWRILAFLATPLPTTLLDAIYDFIAGVRYRLFKPPADVCPLMPKELRARFDY